jgi:hypothetical protein
MAKQHFKIVTNGNKTKRLLAQGVGLEIPVGSFKFEGLEHLRAHDDATCSQQ